MTFSEFVNKVLKGQHDMALDLTKLNQSMTDLQTAVAAQTAYDLKLSEQLTTLSTQLSAAQAAAAAAADPATQTAIDAVAAQIETIVQANNARINPPAA